MDRNDKGKKNSSPSTSANQTNERGAKEKSSHANQGSRSTQNDAMQEADSNASNKRSSSPRN